MDVTMDVYHWWTRMRGKFSGRSPVVCRVACTIYAVKAISCRFWTQISFDLFFAIITCSFSYANMKPTYGLNLLSFLHPLHRLVDNWAAVRNLNTSSFRLHILFPMNTDQGNQESMGKFDFQFVGLWDDLTPWTSFDQAKHLVQYLRTTWFTRLLWEQSHRRMAYPPSFGRRKGINYSYLQLCTVVYVFAGRITYHLFLILCAT